MQIEADMRKELDAAEEKARGIQDRLQVSVRAIMTEPETKNERPACIVNQILGVPGPKVMLAMRFDTCMHTLNREDGFQLR